MTNAPYLLKKHRGGARAGHDTAYDHMFLDGLEDAYEEGRAMGTFAQDMADKYQLTREDMDEYSIASLDRANKAIESGAFADEVVPVTVKNSQGRRNRRYRRGTRQGPPGQDPDPAPGIRQGWHDYRRDLILDLRWRGGCRHDAQERGRSQGPERPSPRSPA